MLNKKIIQTIKNQFPHIDFEQDLHGQSFDEWFFRSYLPMLVTKNIGVVRANKDNSASFNQNTFNSIKAHILGNRRNKII
tara:strand:- start:950 stop:1189 length:240 start_codon:yes stop_codon:yes gene_type:complete